jgi:type I restriction enzyme S subunit
VVVSRDAGVGKSAIMRTDMAVSQHFIAWRCGTQLDNHFLYYWLQSAKPEFERIANGSTIKTIGLPYFRELKIPHPPVPEQRAIATALSDVDALLGALERLIAKKRDLKQAAMQQLLTGQTRLTGFPEWDVMPFGQLYAEPSRNGVYKTAEFQGRGTRVVNMGEMFGFDFISDQEMNRVSLTSQELATSGLRDGDLLFGRRSVVHSGAGKCSIVLNPPEALIFESSIIRVRLNRDIADPLFYYYFFASSIGRLLMSVIISGTNVKGIRGSELRDLEIPHPSLPEQTAIAEVLSNMDAEIAALERRREKTRALKQGMMQELLTGKTRLIPVEEKP